MKAFKWAFIMAGLAFSISNNASAMTITAVGGYTPGYSSETIASIFVNPMAAYGDNGPRVKLVINYDKKMGKATVSMNNVDKVPDELKELRIDIKGSCEVFTVGQASDKLFVSNAVAKQFGETRKAVENSTAMTVFKANCENVNNKADVFTVYFQYNSKKGTAIISETQKDDEDAKSLYGLLLAEQVIAK